MIILTSKISDLLTELNKVIIQNLVDEEGYIIAEEIESVMKDKKSPAHDFLLYFLQNEEFKIKCRKLEDFFFSLDSLTKVLKNDQIISKIDVNPEILKDELFLINIVELKDFFKTLPIGLEIIIELILQNLENKDLIKFLLRFDSLEQIFPSRNQFKQFKKIKTVLNSSIDGNIEVYAISKELISKNKGLFPLLYRKVETIYKINEFVTLKLENGESNIYIKGELFNQCKYLLLNIQKKKIKDYGNIDSIDEAVEVNNLSNELEGRRREDEFKIDPKEEFVGHCSNLQAWAENDYDTCILHRNLAFPLLKRLTEVGDEKAMSVFKEEVLKRLVSGHSTVITYLADSGYLKNITDQDYQELFENPQYNLVENLTRGMANKRYSQFVEPIFMKFIQFSQKNNKEYIIRMLENVDSELYSGLRKSKLLESLDREIILELLNKPSCNLKEFYYKFRGKEYFISPKLTLNLANRGLNDLKEIEGLHRLKSLKSIDLTGNNIKEIFGLGNLMNLEQLRLKGNLLNQRLIEDLGGLDKNGDANLPQKFVEYCQVNAYHQIEYVSVYGNQYEVINGRLNLSKSNINELSDITGIFDLKDLKYVDLSYNNLKNVDDLQSITSIEYLDLSHNQLKEFNVLELLTNLKVIRLNGNKIKRDKIPSLNKIQKNQVVDLDSRRKIGDKEYLTYLLQSLTVNDMIGLCKQFGLRKYSGLTRDKLIEFIPHSMMEFETRDAIKKLEQEIISKGLKNALLSLKKMSTKKIEVKFIEGLLIQITTINFDNRQIKSTLQIAPSNLDNPLRHCECKVGRKRGFCTHFWYGMIFALKTERFNISDWTLTILPKNLEKLIEPIQVNEIVPNEYRFINKDSVLTSRSNITEAEKEDIETKKLEAKMFTDAYKIMENIMHKEVDKN